MNKGAGDSASPSASDANVAALLDMIGGSWKSQAIGVAAQLRLADLLASGPRTSADLAAATQTDPPSLHRLLRALATIDLCKERDNGAFELTPTGRLLASDSPRSLRCWAIWSADYTWPVWGKLLYSVQTGKSARALLTGSAGFDHLKSNPEAAAVFHTALAELTRIEADGVMHAYDFAPLTRIVDLGGGHGEMLARILTANPNAHGILFDLSHALDGARAQLAAAGVETRCELLAGDFFTAVPAAITAVVAHQPADAYLLKNVLHDWDDASASRILAQVRRAMQPGARLLIIERILADRADVSAVHQSNARADLNMLIALAASERTESQFRKLLAGAGSRIARIIPAGMSHSIIEAFVAG